MIKKKLGIIPFLLSITSFANAELVYPDFMTSMTREGQDKIQYELIQESASLGYLTVFLSSYKNSLLREKKDENVAQIPKIIHQIWLGSPVPAKFADWMQSWMDWVGWEYKLWTDDDISSFPLYNQELYQRAGSYGEKTDILRLEILLHFGGIYVDVDFRCVKPAIFEELSRDFDFYIGFEPIVHGTMSGIPKICNALIAATPYHPLIKDLIINMKDNWILHEKESGIQKAGPDYFSRTILAYEIGSLLFPEKKSDNMEYHNIYLPCTFFYKFSDQDIKSHLTEEEILEGSSVETAAIHYWSGSWRPK